MSDECTELEVFILEKLESRLSKKGYIARLNETECNLTVKKSYKGIKVDLVISVVDELHLALSSFYVGYPAKDDRDRFIEWIESVLGRPDFVRIEDDGNIYIGVFENYDFSFPVKVGGNISDSDFRRFSSAIWRVLTNFDNYPDDIKRADEWGLVLGDSDEADGANDSSKTDGIYNDPRK